MKTAARRILLLSAYDAVSHRLWRERLSRLFEQDSWTQLTLAPRHFSWRVRGNSLLWALTEKETLEQDYDLLIATSMVDLSALRGFVPSLAQIPTLVYFHENQFAYPSNRQTRPNVEHQLVPLYAALCADHIAFNSHYNRHTFLAGAEALIKKLPDKIPATCYQQLLQSTVVPVPLAQPAPSVAGKTEGPLQVIWNHRWEYDKGPELLYQVVSKLIEAKVPIRLHMVGEKFKQIPAQFPKLIECLENYSKQCGIPLGRIGYIESKTDYADLLASCDVVLSTALHDFQGLAVQEACLAGCIPLAPNDLAYPDYLPQRYLYPLQADDQNTAQVILEHLSRLVAAKSLNAMPPLVDLSAYMGPAIITKYDEVFNTLLAKEKAETR
jgi:glycosyltransferase involved in cell wall biosynthesis